MNENKLEEEPNQFILPFLTKFKNEKQIKECKIKINDEIIQFNYFHQFKEIGKYKIKYIFEDDLTNMCYMFYNCNSIENIDLSNFKTENVEYMDYMFNGCASLKSLDLSNLNTQKVKSIMNLLVLYFDLNHFLLYLFQQ